METRHLAVANRNIVEGEARVERQLALIERLKTRGADTCTAEDFLDLLRQTLAEWNSQRALIITALKA